MGAYQEGLTKRAPKSGALITIIREIRLKIWRNLTAFTSIPANTGSKPMQELEFLDEDTVGSDRTGQQHADGNLE
jgi:hypothetical protein